MGNVILVYKVLPKDPKNLRDAKRELEGLGAERIEEEPIGFGITALKVTLIVPDEGGVQDNVEEKLSKLGSIQSFELLRYGRAL